MLQYLMAKKNKKKKEKISPKNEFRINKLDPRKHPVHIFARAGNDYVFFVITHSEQTRGVKNIKLHKNPDPRDKDKSYFNPKPRRQRVSSFGNVKTNFVLSKIDDEKMKPLRFIPTKKERLT